MNKVQSIGYLFFMVGLMSAYHIPEHQILSVVIVAFGAAIFLLGAE